MEEIKKGIIVQLKSGGPLMTVEKIGEVDDYDDGILCVWFNQRDKTVERVFERSSLVICEDEEALLPSME
ncbi:MAG: DUF2158 domain-containing protein [Desulfobacteraceae bacterium]|nr:DUF2158 domain-containing protein [Desulfobacteraceae bacterium]